MKTLVRLFPLAFVLLTSCDKKTTAVETQPLPEPPGEETQPVGDAATPPAVADAALSPLDRIPADDRAKYEAWFKKHNIGSDAPSLARDEDGDGYSNLEEFKAETNPRDANSMPGVVEGVTLKVVNEVKIPLLLREVKGTTAQVERLDGGVPEELKAGVQPKGLPYKVTAVKHEVQADKHGVFTDISNVTLENPETKETVMLVKDLPARSSETHAIIAGADGKEQKIRIDETITLPGHGTKQFKVLELRNDQVVVEELGSKKPLTIQKQQK